MPRYEIRQTEIYYIDADDPQDAIEALDDMDEDDKAAAYDHRAVIVVDVETGAEIVPEI